MKTVKILILILSLVLISPVIAQADDTLDAMETALDFYKKGKLSKAIGELEFALAQLRQKKAEALEKLLPAAPDGWSAHDEGTTAGGAAMFGGGVSASRKYSQTGGRGKATVEFVTNSPMLQGMAAMMQNPAFVQGSKGAKLIRFQGEKAILTSRKSKQAELQLVLNNKMLFKVTVRGVEDAPTTAKQFGKLVDLEKLMEFAK